jgi:DedD protein
MAKQLDEDALKRQARRRLIGATVLATVVVAVLPMLLDSEPKSVVKDIELRIPDKDKAGEFVPNVALPPVPAPAAVAPASAVAAAQAAVSASVAEASQQPASRPVQTQAVAHEQKAAQAKPAEAEQKEQAAQQAGFIVQIGAFSNADTARRWQKNLVKQGVKAYTEKAGDKLRVRAGPYATREAAEKVRHRLESQGLHPNIVALD